jgi:hypothetical protein
MAKNLLPPLHHQDMNHNLHQHLLLRPQLHTAVIQLQNLQVDTVMLHQRPKPQPNNHMMQKMADKHHQIMEMKQMTLMELVKIVKMQNLKQLFKML